MIKLLLANLALTPLVALTYKSHSACSPGTPEIIADILQPLGRHTNGAETTQHEQDITSLFAKLKVNYAGLNQLAQPVLWDTPFDLSFVSDELLPLSVIPIQLPWFEFETPIRLIITRGLPCVIVGNNDLGSLGYKLTRELPGHLITTQAGEDDLPLASPHIVQDHINMESFIKKKKKIAHSLKSTHTLPVYVIIIKHYTNVVTTIIIIITLGGVLALVPILWFITLSPSPYHYPHHYKT